MKTFSLLLRMNAFVVPFVFLICILLFPACRKAAEVSAPGAKEIFVYKLVGSPARPPASEKFIPEFIDVSASAQKKLTTSKVTAYLEDALLYDEYCLKQYANGAVFYARSEDSSQLIPCVCNAEGNWVRVPGESNINARRFAGSWKWPRRIIGDTYVTDELKEGEVKNFYMYR